MTEGSYGVYFRAQTPQGVLVSFSREKWSGTDGIEGDIKEVFGEVYFNSLLDILTGVVVVNAPGNGGASWPQGQPQSAGVQTPAAPSAAPPAQPQYEAPATVQEAVQQAPAQQFEVCAGCGQPKSRWIAPGISQRTQKPYPGFFACNTQGCRGGK